MKKLINKVKIEVVNMCQALSAMTFYEHIALWGAIIGSLLMALNLSISGFAFIPYLLSNFASIYLLNTSHASKALTHQTYFFIIINIVGIIRWLL